MRSRGSVEFAKRHAPKEWSRLLGKSGSTVYSWATGSREPNRSAKIAIHEAGGPDPSAWAEVAPLPEVARVIDIPVEPATPELVANTADQLLAHIRRLQATIVEDPLGDPGQQARTLAQLATAAQQLGRLTAVGLQLSERQILASPNWGRIRDAIDRGLAEWPDAARSVASELEALEGVS